MATMAPATAAPAEKVKGLTALLTQAKLEDKLGQAVAWCVENGLDYSTSVWDVTAAREIAELQPSGIKVPSACNNNLELLRVLRDEYEGRFHRWLAEASTMASVDAARRAASHAGGDMLVNYQNKADLLRMCKSLGLMEDLKAGVPRTAYHGVILVRMHGRRLFLAPSYKVDQDITAS